MEPTKEHTALCCICEREFPENKGTFSIPAYRGEGALFVCSECQDMSETYDYPIDWDEGKEDEDNPQSDY
jgi:hypothetical protein